MQEPLDRLKEIIKPIGQLDYRSKTQFTISTKEPHLLEQLITELNKRAASEDISIKKEGMTELKSANRFLYQYRIVAREELKREQYEQAMTYFKRSLPHLAGSFLMAHRKKD